MEDIEELLLEPHSLLHWYDLNKRSLPWREESCSPYGVWVSEIMCQQTRVDTVVGYYKKWMTAFPTVKELALASADQVNSLWAGLGYYRRARNLHAGAQKVYHELGGEMPSTVADLLSIPGIGPYTAGAIASIAFKRQAAVVDGNVIRVFARLGAVEEQPSKLLKACWKVAEKIVPQSRSGDFNQSLMELGATVCTPANPKCDQCPISSICRGKENPSKYPLKNTKKTPPIEYFSVYVISRNDKYALTQRPLKGLLAGQWEFPSFAPDVAFLQDIQHKKEVGQFVHKFSHRHHHLKVFSCQVPTDFKFENDAFVWMTQAEIHEKGLTKAMVESLKLATETKKRKKRT